MVLYIMLLSILLPTCRIQKFRSSFPLLSRNPLSPADAGVVPLDNLCLTNINSPRSKCNVIYGWVAA